MSDMVVVHTPMTGAESEMVTGLLVQLGFDAVGSESGPLVGVASGGMFPVSVPAFQAEEAKRALEEQGIAAGSMDHSADAVAAEYEAEKDGIGVDEEDEDTEESDFPEE